MPTTSVNFYTKCLSLLNLKVSIRCGCSFSAFQTRCTAILEIPRCFAKLRVVQCVRPSGFTCTVVWMMRSLISGVTTRLRPLWRRRSRSRSAARSGTGFSVVPGLSTGACVSRAAPRSCGFGSLAPGFRFGPAPPPQGRGLAINVQLPADLAVAMPLTGQQDNPSPLRQLLGGVSSPRQRLQSSTHCVVDEYCQCHGLSEHTSRKMSSFDCGFTLAAAVGDSPPRVV